MATTYYFGQDAENALGDSPRYLYLVRRNDDGELFLRRVDNIVDKDSIDINLPGPPNETFEDFESGIDYFDGVRADHEKEYNNMYYTQYRWDGRSMLYYVDDEGMLVERINQGYTYPTGTSS
jgi:hypothetical protein